jgi:signal transduction histidine kinase
MGLKALLGSVAAGALIMPIALAIGVRFLFYPLAPDAPVFRFQYVSDELLAAVRYEGGAISIKEGYAPPAGLKLVIEGSDGTILLSNVEGFAPGGGARLEEVAAKLLEDPAAKNFFAESVRSASGAVVGSYFAWFAEGFRSARRAAVPASAIALSTLIALAFGFGALVATKLGRAVLKLERAAGRIAAGDLESEVGVDGIKEIEALSRAMDGMRLALREDRDRRARFLAAVSHDLRTPLTSIGGYLEAVEDGLASDPRTLERYVAIMRGKARLLEGRISGLIEFARMETGEWRLGFEELELGPFLEDLAREFSEDAALMGRDFSFELSALGGLRAGVDRALLARALENLVSNAIRYSPEGGAVRLGSRREPGPDGGAYVIDLDDEGPGIAPSERDRVFEPFVRGSASREGDGNGLGLYIARSVIAGHGWGIVASEAPGGGGRFSVSIPAAAGKGNP